MTDPMANARRRPIIVPSLPPVTINMAMTSVYSVIAVCTPVTSVPRSLATVAMETFMTELSRVMRNWPDARVSRTRPLPRGGPAILTGMEQVRRLVLIRHAKAAEGNVDRERPLAKRGMNEAPEIGRWLAERQLVPDRVVVSPALRARQTWERATTGLDGAVDAEQ